MSGVRPLRLHDLRHGQASLLLAAGVPLAVVSKRLGHSPITITSDTYSHLLEGVGRQAAEAATRLVPRGRRSDHPQTPRDRSVTTVAPDGTDDTGSESKSAGQDRWAGVGLDPRSAD